MCHNDHHGRTFKIIRFTPEKFNHNLTGYKLEGAHAKKLCKDCHKPEFIKSTDIKKKKFTYLGLETRCLSCHEDYHRKTLSENCLNCHNNNSFKPATLFSHDKTKFPLLGKHKDVVCLKCHKTELADGKKYQAFSGIKYDNCTRCHTDAHNNKFGQNCKQCHSESGFQNIKSSSGFDHDKTNFPLNGRHKGLNCKQCHKNKVTDPLKHERCLDCHKDYHEGQFTKLGYPRDCAECHETKGFAGSNYTIELHNKSNFPLEGAHLATPCFICHKKTEKWNFRFTAKTCNDCHENIHEPNTSRDQYRNGDCKICHTQATWSKVNYDHSKTKFPLSGIHATTSCRECHFRPVGGGTGQPIFSGLKEQCTFCHDDIHNQQFVQAGVTDCRRCHAFDKWQISNFDHNQASFKLDGKHKALACIRCHGKVQDGGKQYVLYKTKKTKCEDCH
jgi:hypothetical protein